MWRSIPFAKRKLLIKKYNIKKSGSTEIINNQVVRDGVAPNDIEKISIGILEEILGIKVKKNDEKNKEENIK